MEIQSIILQKLSQFGITESDISFHSLNGSPYFKYQSWRYLPDSALTVIQDISNETYFEDYDGDGDGGRPIIRRMWYYEFCK